MGIGNRNTTRRVSHVTGRALLSSFGRRGSASPASAISSYTTNASLPRSSRTLPTCVYPSSSLTLGIQYRAYSNHTQMSDPTSQANYLAIATTHIHFDWVVDYEAEVVKGSATHTLAVKEDDVKEVV